MDKSQKSRCDHREHQDYTTEATCNKFIELTNTSIKFDPSVCEYCIKTKPNFNLSNEPFRSQYFKLRDTKHTQNFKFAGCVLLGEPIVPVETLTISDYLKTENSCHYYGKCTIAPDELRNCQFCKDNLRIKYEFNESPDFNIYDKMPKFGEVRKWAVGVTTAPREHKTIIKTIKSLESAGWDNGTIFSEPGSYIDLGDKWEYVHRSRKTGIFGNWMLGLYELFIRNIDADAYFMIQDDIVLAPESREYLEKSLWFTDKPHLISLFGPNAIDKNPSNGWRSTTNYHGGPNSIIMSHETVQEILSSIVPLQFYGIRHTQNSSFDDLGIFLLMNKKGWPTFYPKPSIGDHIGHQSTHCTQSTRWVYSDRVLCNHQYNDIEHWYITDNHNNEDISKLHEMLSKFKNVNWLVLNKDTDPQECLKNRCKSKWIITTELPVGTKLLSDIKYEVIKHFVYSTRWLKFGFGISNGEYIYTESGPCKSLCEETSNLRTCLSKQLPTDDCKIIKNMAFWSR